LRLFIPKHIVFIALMASDFFCLPQKSNQKEGTHHHGLRLPCVAQQNKPVTKLDLAAHTIRELLRDSNSRSLSSYFVSATQRDGMGFVSPNDQW
jgi:hypothetical protein